VPFLGVCCDIDRAPAMVSPLYRNDTVDQYVKRCPHANRLAIVSLHYHRKLCHSRSPYFVEITGLARGLGYIHYEDVIHGDVKSVRYCIPFNHFSLFDAWALTFTAKRAYRRWGHPSDKGFRSIEVQRLPRIFQCPAPELTAEPDEHAYEARENGALQNVAKQIYSLLQWWH
jgi:hypothetical protein